MTMRTIMRHTLQLALLLVVCLVGLGQGQQVPPFRPELNDPLLRDLAYWWRAVPGQTDGTSFFDQTPNRADGTLTNMGYTSTSGWSGTDRPGGYAHINLDGTNDYVSTSATPTGQAAGPNINPVGFPFTMCVWAWMNVAPPAGQDRSLLSNMNNGGTFDGIGLNVNDSLIPIFLVVTGAGFFTANPASGTVTLQQWFHLCGTYDGSANQTGMTIYVNGTISAQGSATTISGVWTERPFALGSYNSVAPGNYFNGRLDDAMFFRRTLDAGEIRALYEWSLQGYTTTEGIVAQGVPDPPAGGLSPYIRDPFLGPQVSNPRTRHGDLMGWWLAVEGLDDSAVWHDLSPTGATATLTNMGYGPTSGWGSTDRAGGVAHVAFNGVDNYIYIGPNTTFDFPNQTFVLAVWVRATTPGGYIAVKRLGAVGPGGWFARINSDGTLNARLIDSGDGVVVQQTAASTTWLDGNWHHLLVVYTTDTVTAANNDIHIYHNGTLDDGGYAATSGLPYAACPCDLLFGATSNLQAGTFFNGAIDDVRLYQGNFLAGESATLALQTAVSLASTPPVEGVIMGQGGGKTDSFLQWFR